MHENNLQHWQHEHSFNQDKRRPGESKTLIVIAITAIMMVVEISAGVIYGSMALLADGLHMASHTVALSITAFAYIYARRHAHNRGFSFGTGKVNALGGFTGALLLVIFSLMMALESVERLLNPVAIVFNQAIAVAVLGLLVNALCAYVLGVHNHEHDHGDSPAHNGHDHNLTSAYLHVLADALTSVLAIVALIAAKYYGYVWMDPLMGVVGAILIARWSYGLLRTTSAVLLDKQAPKPLREEIRTALESDEDTRVSDLHVWSIGPEIYSASITVVAHEPASPGEYKARLPESLGLVHVTVEVHVCEHETAL